jgi:hypothetical protein
LQAACKGISGIPILSRFHADFQTGFRQEDHPKKTAIQFPSTPSFFGVPSHLNVFVHFRCQIVDRALFFGLFLICICPKSPLLKLDKYEWPHFGLSVCNQGNSSLFQAIQGKTAIVDI